METFFIYKSWQSGKEKDVWFRLFGQKNVFSNCPKRALYVSKTLQKQSFI